eukprot:CAMPEP_0170752396 /NCGR_PEP_ID=MMETSP0437-20130122/11947_1 /TAXON_ID=0 /ORGANISM="Sexangularia sp." /LENGTH=104 /DNA_ID=CAMNT_0011091465 /DNA_START=638 /DNA_END=953 /DNA_ORIENTATION=-
MQGAAGGGSHAAWAADPTNNLTMLCRPFSIQCRLRHRLRLLRLASFYQEHWEIKDTSARREDGPKGNADCSSRSGHGDDAATKGNELTGSKGRCYPVVSSGSTE